MPRVSRLLAPKLKYARGYRPIVLRRCAVVQSLSIGIASVRRVKAFTWNEEKNQRLKAERGVSFEEVIVHIAAGDVLDIVAHPNPERYAGQRMFIVRIRDAYLVPFVESETEIFLKTIIPSRKATRRYLRGEHDER